MGNRQETRTLILASTDWTPAFDRHLARIEGSHPVSWFRTGWENGVFRALALWCAGRQVASALYATDVFRRRRELVIVAVGAERGRGLVKAVMPALERAARELGARTIRFHTHRRGLVRLARVMGYAVSRRLNTDGRHAFVCRKVMA